MRFPLATLTLTLAGGAALGFACGSAVTPRPQPARPAAGGNGVLARAGGSGWVFGGDHYGDAGYGGYGRPAGYGGAPYGSAADRGTTYGGYHFDPAVVARRERTLQPRYRDYAPRSGGTHGTITGRVQWAARPPLRPAAGCAAPAPAAIVYLVDIQAGRGYLGSEMDTPLGQTLGVGGSLERDACGFTPYLQLAAPLGTELVVDSRAADCELVGVLRAGTAEDGEMFRTTAAGRGGRTRVDLVAPGPIEVSCEPGGARAWVFVQPHPYHVRTDDTGRFRLGSVPPGTYRIAAWSPPAMLTSTQVTVRADHVSTIDLTLR